MYWVQVCIDRDETSSRYSHQGYSIFRKTWIYSQKEAANYAETVPKYGAVDEVHQ